MRTQAWKNYNIRVVWLTALYSVLLIAAVYGFKRQLFGGLAAYVAAVLPALPIIGIFAAMGRYLVEEQDEYIRTLMVRQSLWASAFTLSVATIWGFLESFELAGHVDSYMIVVVWFFGQGVGAIVNKVTRGEAASCA
ncbi:hypothetical protein [Sphingomonas sediminicola]|nr:hypothetical protein [Sphingomonas sediminicola]